MNKKQQFVISILCVAIAVLAVVAVAVSKKSEKVVYGEFKPPEFDQNAKVGEPTVDKEYYYSEIFQDGMPYKVKMCGKPRFHDKCFADLYFTNPSENEAWLKLRIYDEKNEIIAETGLIKPGEHIQSVEFNREMSAPFNAVVKVMSYEPATYYSLGAVTLDVSIGG